MFRKHGVGVRDAVHPERDGRTYGQSRVMIAKKRAAVVVGATAHRTTPSHNKMTVWIKYDPKNFLDISEQGGMRLPLNADNCVMGVVCGQMRCGVVWCGEKYGGFIYRSGYTAIAYQ